MHFAAPETRLASGNLHLHALVLLLESRYHNDSCSQSFTERQPTSATALLACLFAAGLPARVGSLTPCLKAHISCVLPKLSFHSAGFKNASTGPEHHKSCIPQAILVHKGFGQTGRERVPRLWRDRQEVVKAETEIRRMQVEKVGSIDRRYVSEVIKTDTLMRI